MTRQTSDKDDHLPAGYGLCVMPMMSRPERLKSRPVAVDSSRYHCLRRGWPKPRRSLASCGTPPQRSCGVRNGPDVDRRFAQCAPVLPDGDSARSLRRLVVGSGMGPDRSVWAASGRLIRYGGCCQGRAVRPPDAEVEAWLQVVRQGRVEAASHSSYNGYY